MKKSFLLRRSIVEQSKDNCEMTTIASLLSAMQYENDYFGSLTVSVDQIGGTLYGATPDRQQKKRILNGLHQLRDLQLIQMTELSSSLFEIVLCNFNKKSVDTGEYVVVLYTNDLINIFRADTTMDKFKLYNVLTTIIVCMDYSKKIEQTLRYKFCTTPIYYLANQADMASRTFTSYVQELEKLGILYVMHSNGMYNIYKKMRITNIYCRTADSVLCGKYAKQINFMSTNDFTYDTNFRRKMKQIYNQICKGKIDYSESVYNELIMYINDAETAVGYDINIVHEAQQKALKNFAPNM